MYPNDDACLDKIFKNRYGNISECPTCHKKTNFYKRAGLKCYSCQWCGHCLFPLADTIFHKSSTSLKDWFYVIFLFSNSKNGVAAKEIERQLGVTYKCAWRICNKVRQLFADDIDTLGGGTVEMDETYVGGKEKNKHHNKKILHAQGRSLKAKIPVIGIMVG
jgi:hypothetical protein